MKKLLAALALTPAVALAQVSSGYIQGQVLSAGSLNLNFSLAAAVTNGTLTNPTITGGTITGSTLSGVTIPLAGLAAQAANTVVANATGSSVSPTAFPMPSCSTSGSALTWTTSTGFTCNAAVNAATLGGATFASPGPVGSTTASTGAFTTLSASSTVSGAGFTTLLGPYALLASPALTGVPTAPTALAGTNTTQIATTAFTTAIFAAPPAIGSTIPAAANFTTIGASGLISPTSTIGIKGTTTNDAPAAGNFGETQTGSTTGTSMTTSTATNCTSKSLTAGDWDVWGTVVFVPNAGTTIQNIQAGVSTTSATLPALGSYALLNASFTTATNQVLFAPVQPISLASTTTVYIVGVTSFGVSTMTCNGYIWARRVR